MSKMSKQLFGLTFILVLLLAIIRIGQKSLWVDRQLDVRASEETSPSNALQETAVMFDSPAKKRIVANAYIDNPSLLKQVEINELKKQSVTERNRLLSYYRAFLDPSTPDLKPLIIEMPNSAKSIETIGQFDIWVAETF